MKETDVQIEITSWLSYNGFLVLRINSGRRGGGKTAFNRWYPIHQSKVKPKSITSGISDLIAIKDGMVFMIEVKKSEYSDPSEKQQIFLGECEKVGAIPIVTHSVDDLINKINALSVFEVEY